MPAMMLMPSAMPRSLHGEGVGDDGQAVRHQQGAADALHDAQDDEEHGPARSRHRRCGPGDRRHREHGETGVVHADPAEDIADPAQV